jgi:hypothetical protein
LAATAPHASSALPAISVIAWPTFRRSRAAGTKRRLGLLPSKETICGDVFAADRCAAQQVALGGRLPVPRPPLAAITDGRNRVIGAAHPWPFMGTAWFSMPDSPDKAGGHPSPCRNRTWPTFPP